MEYYVTIKSDEEFLITGEDAYLTLSEFYFNKIIEKGLKGYILHCKQYL